jgi:REP element-mobilizing transposase RayT
MAETALVLTSAQRSLVEETIKAHCRIRGWTLHAVNARRTHVHVVVTADCDPATVMNQLKAWCTRRLKEHAKVKARSASKGTTEAGVRKHWWTEGGSKRYVFDDEGLDQVTDYTLNRQ